MSAQYHTLVVVLEENLSETAAAKLSTAIEHMRGVLSVTAKPVDLESYMAESRARRELGEKIWEVLYPTKS